jgi:thioredoxin 1
MASGSSETMKTSLLFVLLLLIGTALGWLLSAPTTYSRGQVENVSEATFAEVVLESRMPVLVHFYADWCSPCRRLEPVLEEAARDARRAKIVKVNVDQNRALAALYGVSSLPTLMVFKDGQVIAKQTGAISKNGLKAMLDL